jgi:hypothetical protein
VKSAANLRAVSWEAVTALSTAGTTVVILVTAVAGVAQLRPLRAQRCDSAAVELIAAPSRSTSPKISPAIVSMWQRLKDFARGDA